MHAERSVLAAVLWLLLVVGLMGAAVLWELGR